nr:hypothetical protein [Tanacetum cinerariifolium]
MKEQILNQGVPDVTEEESTKSEAESWGRDEDDNNIDHDLSSEGSDQESDSGDDNTQSEKEKNLDSKHEIGENETGFKSNYKENEEEVEDDEEEKEEESVKTPSNYASIDEEDETNVELKVENKAEGDRDKEMGYTTNQFKDDMDVRLNEPINTDEGFIQKEGTDAKMINVKKGNENLEITLNQVIEDARVTISTVIKKTEVLVTSSSYSSDLTSKFLDFSDIHHTNVEIVSPMDVHVHHEDHKASQDSTSSNFANEMSNFAPPVIKSMVTESLEHAVLANESSQPQSTYELAEEPEFEVVDSDMPQGKEENQGNDDEEPKRKDASKRDWFTKPKQPQKPIDPDWNVVAQVEVMRKHRKRDPYTTYQDPQEFIYVDNQGRNKLMRSDELYKFGDGTLTRLRTLLDDITKNIRMEYLPQRRWSSLEKKRAHIMINAIDKQLMEKRMMRSFKKFVGGRHYETDLWLLQRTI